MNFRNKKKKDEPNQKIHDDDNNNDNFASIIECLELMMGNGSMIYDDEQIDPNDARKNGRVKYLQKKNEMANKNFYRIKLN
ncbi:hypothetical protein DERP_005737 [Dermatophagoides pteronyssinus]|uniref:Uncharacterized protein n=1 Tax=Dermatophagoides pteronyssinus TaxID=6956 RepID=A0ABQ8JA40_DERPT|nr:hypothetical protein DERP_005737 [Dermatophagoides pteronyssinus]